MNNRISADYYGCLLYRGLTEKASEAAQGLSFAQTKQIAELLSLALTQII